MSRLPDFLIKMDASAQRALLVTFGLFGVIGTVFLLGKTGVIGSFDELQQWINANANSPWALVVLIGVFCVAAFLGVPQFGLIAAAVVAFGPWKGFYTAWIATLFSGSLTFWLGRFAGEDTFRRYGGDMANRLSAFIGRNAFAASAIVRNVPTGPFVIVNMAFGVSQAKFIHYLAGMAVGIVPKIALVAFAGQSVMAALSGSPWVAIGAAAGAGALWIAIMLYARRRVRRNAATQGEILPETTDQLIDTDPRSAE
ncbi:MAG: VTT domain-containing protein [Pseudomonadota bacterium]